MKILNLKDIEIKDVLNRSVASYGGEYEAAVKEIIADVRENGDAALYKYGEKFDGVKLTSLEVSEEETTEAMRLIDGELFKVLEEAAENIRFYHEKQLNKGFKVEKAGGIILGQRVLPIGRVGIYVPGGTASYPSTVLMNALPAKIAGVGEIIVTTPPMKNGKIKPEILAAAKLAGVDKIYKCGGAGAIAALAYGTESIKKVDKIAGPGNVFVALAKKEVFGTVGIDMVAGPSEILVIATNAADADCVAADLLSQAEHDRLATAVLITDDNAFAQAVGEAVEVRLAALPREAIARASIENNGKIIVVDDIEKAAEISNEIAPEHLELCVERPFEFMDKIKNAGSVFLGMNAPEALGDYFAGVNHTLPTSGSAKYSSALSVDDFVKKSSFVYYPEDELRKAEKKIVSFAESEGLSAHARSVSSRFV